MKTTHTVEVGPSLEITAGMKKKKKKLKKKTVYSWAFHSETDV